MDLLRSVNESSARAGWAAMPTASADANAPISRAEHLSCFFICLFLPLKQIFSRVTHFIGLGGEFEIISESGSERSFINNCCRRGVFDCHSGAIENDDLGFAGASGLFAGNSFGELCVNTFFLHQTFR